ncbi:universal stress protein [Limobrevibacterium gyesilva]|uniref:Universal stress protein n=1 Tax=Limobrevibacterium gyesilva TaxID=2991712 RepID=A0AA41YR97_9PROT|nr:universal stress protein [Limobrevibacterium gyesilva]MCW3477112.1 universal stress protein [Limobrevibacterium gyesilva]
MFKHVLVPATGADSDKAVFETALLAARPFGAHLEFLHVRVDVTDVVVAMTAGGIGGGGAIQSVIDRLEAENKALEQKAWQAFSSFCAEAGIATGGSAPGTGLCADLVVETGNEAQWLAEYGRFADLVVVGRTRNGEDVALDVLEAALMDTGKPLLIAAAQAQAALPGTVAIAWKDSPEAARAVSAAMPMIEAAERVVIISVEEDEQTKEETSERLQRALRWHNANTSVQHLARNGRPAVEVLLGAAAGVGANLLVMGGYSHSRLREVVFGGFTQRILRGADLPVLMAH